MTTPPPPPREEELVRKLVTTWHLSVPEHRALPGGKIRASLIYDAIEEILQAEGRFPVEWQPDDSFAGGLIECLEDGSCRVTWRAEFSLPARRHQVVRFLVLRWRHRRDPDRLVGLNVRRGSPDPAVPQPNSSAIVWPWSVIGTGRPVASSSLDGLIPKVA